MVFLLHTRRTIGRASMQPISKVFIPNSFLVCRENRFFSVFNAIFVPDEKKLSHISLRSRAQLDFRTPSNCIKNRDYAFDRSDFAGQELTDTRINQLPYSSEK